MMPKWSTQLTEKNLKACITAGTLQSDHCVLDVSHHPSTCTNEVHLHCRYEYRSTDFLLRDFELMKNNAIKFNGQESPIAQEAISIYDYVKDKIESNRSELTSLEQQVEDQMSGIPKRKKKSGTKKFTVAGATSSVANVYGVSVNLGGSGTKWAEFGWLGKRQR